MPTNPSQTNLNAWWEFNETSGTRYDAHGSYDLTDVNTVGYSASGKQGNAADFENANSERLTRDDESGLSFTGDWTLAGWVKFETIGNGNIYRLATKYKSSPNGDREFVIITSVTGAPTIAVYKSDGTGTSAVWGSNLTTGTWYHITAWCDHTNNSIGISVNAGTPVTATWNDTVNNGSAKFMFGNYDGAASGFLDGLLDEWCWYGRVLSSDERDWLYNSGTGRTYAETATTTTLEPAAHVVTPTFPAVAVARILKPSALVVAPTFPTPAINRSLKPAVHAPAPSFPTPAVNRTIPVSPLAPTTVLPAATVRRSVSLSSVANSATASAPTYTAVAQVALTAVAQGAVPSAPTVSASAQRALSAVDATAVPTSPTVSAEANITPGAVNATASPTAPSTLASMPVGAVNATAVPSTPAVSAAFSIAQGAVNATAVPSAPSWTAVATRAMRAVGLVLETRSPTILLGDIIAAGRGGLASVNPLRPVLSGAGAAAIAVPAGARGGGAVVPPPPLPSRGGDAVVGAGILPGRGGAASLAAVIRAAGAGKASVSSTTSAAGARGGSAEVGSA